LGLPEKFEGIFMSWSSITLPQGSKLFRVHNFTLLHKGSNYSIEIDEFSDGACSGHGEHTTDKNLQIESVTGTSIEGCLQSLVKKIEGRG
jgi:hypothetical protein